MPRVDALRDDGDLPLRERTIPVGPGAFERIRATLDRGVDCWVSAVVSDDAGRVLLVQNRWSDGWIPPGGNVEPGEDPRTAAAREVREETGVAADVRDPIAVVEETFACDGRTASGRRVAFAARAETTALATDPGLDGEGIEAVGWFEQVPDHVEQRWLLERGLERLR